MKNSARRILWLFLSLAILAETRKGTFLLGTNNDLI